MAPNRAPPGTWKQFLSLISGFLLLLILAPSGSSSSTRQRTKRYVFSAKDINTADGSATNCSRSGSYKKAGAMEVTGASKTLREQRIDPTQWKRLSPHRTLEGELIAVESSEGSQQPDGLAYTSSDVGNEGDTRQQMHHDSWYVLENVHSPDDASFELKVAFPLETPVDMDLDVSVWTLQGAQALLPMDVRLAEHFSENKVMFARVRLLEVEPRVSFVEHEPSTSRRTRSGTENAHPMVEYKLSFDRMYLNNTITHSELLHGVTTTAVVAGMIAVVAGYLILSR